MWPILDSVGSVGKMPCAWLDLSSNLSTYAVGTMLSGSTPA